MSLHGQARPRSNVKRLLALLVALGVLASVWMLWTRSRTPQGGPEAEFVVELETVYESSRLHGISVDDLLDAYREAGVTTVGVEAKSLARLEFDGQATLVYDPSTGFYNVKAASPELQSWLGRELARWAPRHLVLAGQPVPGSLAAALPAFYPPARKDLVLPAAAIFRRPSDPLAVTPPERDLILGICPADVEMVRRHGLLAAAFLPNPPAVTEQQALWLLEGLGDGSGFTAVKFDGDTALGWPDPAVLEAVGRKLAELGVPFVVDDQPEAGLVTVGRAAGWRGIRQQPVWTRVEPNRFPEVAVERRQNFLYLQTAFFDGTSADWLDQVTAGIRDIVAALRASGLELAKTVPFTPYDPPAWALAAVVSGVMAAAILGLLYLFENHPGGGRADQGLGRAAGRVRAPVPSQADLAAARTRRSSRPAAAGARSPDGTGAGLAAPTAVRLWRAAIVAALVLFWAVPTAVVLLRGSQAVGLTAQVEYLTGFLAVTVLPLFGLIPALRHGPAAPEATARPAWTRRVWLAVAVTVGAAALATAGGLLTTASGANTAFMLRLEIFRGTKMSLLLPPVIAAVAFLGLAGLYAQPPLERSGGSVVVRALNQLRQLLAENITVIYVILFGLAAVAAFILIIRSGNFPTLGVSTLELKVRAFLQRVLVVRPRTKEFLIGYPSLVLLVWWAARWRERTWTRWVAFLLAVAAAIGLVSVGNTFAHQHIPVSISLRRTFNGLALGLPIGLALAAATEVGLLVWARRRKRQSEAGARGGGKSPS